MASTPQFKVYTADGEYIAACKDATDAAALAGLHGAGTTIRYGHKLVVWREGAEADLAGNSYDLAAETIYARVPR